MSWMNRFFFKTGMLSRGPLLLLVPLALLALGVSGCRGDQDADGKDTTSPPPAATAATQTSTAESTPPGIVLDPALASASGIPTPDEMKALIALQAQVPYEVIVPTFVPGGYQLDAALIGHSGPSGTDPVGYYSFRYYNPGQDILNMTFNQSQANSKPLSGYYLTDHEVNGQAFQVYWHKAREYLPDGDPVRADYVGDAEGFVIVWQGQYTAADGSAHPLYYAITTSTYTGIDWYTMQQIIAGLKPLAAVGG